MNKTSIEWVVNPDGTQGYTWNPVTGCLYGCNYCYARKIAMRFQGNFEPEFHPERLSDPLKIKKSSTIFVCSMADLFGNWVESEWIEQIFNVVKKCPQHTFLFLTKNGQRIANHDPFIDADNVWYGQSYTGLDSDVLHIIPCRPCIPSRFRAYISFEPLLGCNLPTFEGIDFGWIIIGSLNQNGKPVSPDKGGTRKEWVLALIDHADRSNTPVFIKDSVYKMYPDLPQRREVPYLKHENTI